MRYSLALIHILFFNYVFSQDVQQVEVLKNDKQVTDLFDKIGDSEIKLESQKKHSEVKKQYYNSDCLIVTSRYETFCNVIIEAMMCGLKVISTNVGIANEVINKKNGVIIENNSISLINAINKVIKLQNDDNRISLDK